MADKIFVDTNVLVYPYDRADRHKQERALEVLDALARGGRGQLSVQVLAEFFWVVTTKLADALRVDEAEQQVQAYLKAWTVADLTSLIVVEAVRGVRAHRLSYWDAQIWAAALLTQTSVVLSEDFQDGAVIEGIRFVNPFSRKFQLIQLET